MRVNSVEELDALPVATVLRIDGRAGLLAARVEDGLWLTFSKATNRQGVPSERLWEACEVTDAVLDIISLPGGSWLGDAELNYAVASSVLASEIVNLLATKAASQNIELGFTGAPAYIEAHEILNLFISVGETYGIDAWTKAINGEGEGE